MGRRDYLPSQLSTRQTRTVQKDRTSRSWIWLIVLKEKSHSRYNVPNNAIRRDRRKMFSSFHWDSVSAGTRQRQNLQTNKSSTTIVLRARRTTKHREPALGCVHRVHTKSTCMINQLCCMKKIRDGFVSESERLSPTWSPASM